MKAIHAFFVLFLIGLTVSCASIYGVKYDFDQQANFADLKTFDWMPVPEKAGINSLVVQRVKKAVNAELQAKGLMVTSNNPDFLIAQHLGKRIKCKSTIGDTAIVPMEDTGLDTGGLLEFLHMNTKKDHSFWILWMLNRKK